MNGPVYRVPVTYRGARYLAHVQALPLLGDNWAVGYVTSTGRHHKLTVKGNEQPLHSEAECIERLERLAAARGWERVKDVKGGNRG